MPGHKRFRLRDEEYEVIYEMRQKRLKEDNSRGGRIRGAQIANAHNAMTAEELGKKTGALRMMEKQRKGEALVQSEGLAPASYGAVPGMEAELTEGTLREDVVVDVTSESVGIISDAHWPFHDLRRDGDGNYYGAYLIALQSLKDASIGTLVLNGDMMDCFHLSAHEKLEARRDWKWELDVTRAMLKHLRDFFGDGVRIIYREGNHEERFERYMARQAKELNGVYDLAELMGLREHGIEWVRGRAKITIGKLWVDHGHEWFGGGGVMPARNFRMKSLDNIIVGHVHKTSHDLFRRPLGGDFIAGWSVGCLCDLNPHYAPRNNWNHGFAHVTLSGDGNFTVSNRVIIDGVAR